LAGTGKKRGKTAIAYKAKKAVAMSPCPKKIKGGEEKTRMVTSLEEKKAAPS